MSFDDIKTPINWVSAQSDIVRRFAETGELYVSDIGTLRVGVVQLLEFAARCEGRIEGECADAGKCDISSVLAKIETAKKVNDSRDLVQPCRCDASVNVVCEMCFTYDTLCEARRVIERLELALKPFAVRAAELPINDRPDDQGWYSIEMRHWREAARIVNA